MEHLAATRPELKGRLPDVSQLTVTPIATMDTSRTRDVLGLKEYINWRKTVDDTIDSFLEIERSSN